MNLKELATAVSIENNIPANVSKKITTSVLNQIAKCIVLEEPLQTQILRMRIVNRPERSVDDEINGGKKIIAATKFGRLIIRAPKE